MPYYRNTKTGITVKWTEKHHSKVSDRKYWELVEEAKPAPKKKAAKKKAGKK
jgi:hypothetical protein